MRAFVALEVPESVLRSLAVFQDEVRSTGADLKLVERENLHFTVRFLGDITEAQAADAASRLGRLSLSSIDVEVEGAGAFPSTTRPRVVWAGVANEDESAISSIAAEAIESLRDIGERDDRPFRAHITLARVRSPRNSKQLAELIGRNTGRHFGRARLTELKLKSSILTPHGPVYTDIGAFRLA